VVLARREKGTAWWWSLVPAVLGVSLLDRWRCAASGVSPVPQWGRRPLRCDAHHLLLLLPPPPPNCLMTKARGLVQPSWGTTPNRVRHTAGLGDHIERRRGLRAPSAGTPAGQGMGAAPTLNDVAQPKATVVVGMQGRRSCGGGTDHTVAPRVTVPLILL
jgi:hypothetical protein